MLIEVKKKFAVPNRSSTSMPSIFSSPKAKQYRLKDKVTPYQRQFESSENKKVATSNLYQLAETLYARNQNSQFSSHSPSRIRPKTSIDKNPEEGLTKSVKFGHSIVQQVDRNKSATIINNLQQKANKVPVYSSLLMDLIKQKMDLQHQNDEMRRLIAQEKKLVAKIKQIKSRTHANHIDNYNQSNRNIRNQLFKTKVCVKEEEDICDCVRRELADINDHNDLTIKKIVEETDNIANLKNFNKQAKHTIIREDKELNELKSNLTIALKSMQNNANYIKYLEHEYAGMLLHVNREVQQHWHKK